MTDQMELVRNGSFALGMLKGGMDAIGMPSGNLENLVLALPPLSAAISYPSIFRDIFDKSLMTIADREYDLRSVQKNRHIIGGVGAVEAIVSITAGYAIGYGLMYLSSRF